MERHFTSKTRIMTFFQFGFDSVFFATDPQTLNDYKSKKEYNSLDSLFNFSCEYVNTKI